MNFYKRYSGDYLRDTARLSLTEHGAYCLLMDYYYSDEQPLPADRTECYMLVRALRKTDQAAVDKVLDLYFELRDDGWHHDRIDEEIAKGNAARKAAQENGKKGGNPWVKEHYNAPGYLYAIEAREPGIVKVGITIDPKRRLGEHRGNGCGDVLAVVPVAKMGVAEKGLLKTFANVAEGEWLTLDETGVEKLLKRMESYRVADHPEGSLINPNTKRGPKNEGDHEGENVPQHVPQHRREHEGEREDSPDSRLQTSGKSQPRGDAGVGNSSALGVVASLGDGTHG